MRVRCNKWTKCKRKGCKCYSRHFYKNSCNGGCDYITDQKCVPVKSIEHRGKHTMTKQGILYHPDLTTSDDTRYTFFNAGGRRDYQR